MPSIRGVRVCLLGNGCTLEFSHLYILMNGNGIRLDPTIIEVS